MHHVDWMHQLTGEPSGNEIFEEKAKQVFVNDCIRIGSTCKDSQPCRGPPGFSRPSLSFLALRPGREGTTSPRLPHSIAQAQQLLGLRGQQAAARTTWIHPSDDIVVGPSLAGPFSIFLVETQPISHQPILVD